MSKKLAVAALAAMMSASFTLPALAADPAAKPATQVAPKAKADAAKVEGKAKRDGQTARNKAETAKPAAKDAAKKTDKTL